MVTDWLSLEEAPAGLKENAIFMSVNEIGDDFNFSSVAKKRRETDTAVAVSQMGYNHITHAGSKCLLSKVPTRRTVNLYKSSRKVHRL